LECNFFVRFVSGFGGVGWGIFGGWEGSYIDGITWFVVYMGVGGVHGWLLGSERMKMEENRSRVGLGEITREPRRREMALVQCSE
jgi:hypothetical protein